MSSFFDRVSRDLDRLARDKLRREESPAQLSDLSDGKFCHEYQIMCEEIEDDVYNLGADASKMLYGQNITLEEVKHDRAQLVEHLKELEVLHAEFLRRYFERKRPQGGTKNATV